LERQLIEHRVEHNGRDVVRGFYRQGETPSQIGLCIRQLALVYTLPRQLRKLLDREPQRFTSGVSPRIRLGDEITRLLHRLTVRLGAVGQAAIGPQHTMQAVRALATED